jgi:hypothetical protein
LAGLGAVPSPRRQPGGLEKLLAEGESFTGLTVERLASVAGVSRSMFYVCFEDNGPSSSVGDVMTVRLLTTGDVAEHCWARWR